MEVSLRQCVENSLPKPKQICHPHATLTTAGVGRLGLVDQDAVELSNLHRQISHTEARVGQHKAASAAEACHSLNSSIQVRG